MSKFIRLGALSLMMLTLSSASFAETLYIRDLVLVNLREAPAGEATTIKLLRTGDKLDVLEPGGEFVKVRTSAGEVGWVPKQYTSGEAPAAVRVVELERELKNLHAKLDDAMSKEAEASSALSRIRTRLDKDTRDSDMEIAKSRKEAKDLSSELATLKNQYESLRTKSGNVVEISDENELLKEENQLLTAQNEQMLKKVTELEKYVYIKWFVAGALVFLVGWMLGVFGGRKKRQRVY